MDEPNRAGDDPAPLADLRKAAGGGLAKAAGVDGLDRLVTSQSSSDGSLGGDSRELAANTAAGARLGAKVGAAPGAAIGAAAGAATTAARNKRTRRRLFLVLIAPTLAGLLLLGFVIVGLGSITSGQDQHRDGMSSQAALTDGLTDDQIGVYRAAADSAGVSWTVLAAVDRSAGHWAGPGDPPYGITDVAAFNQDLVRHGLQPIEIGQIQDRVAAGYAYGRLFAARLADTDPDRDPAPIDAGAGVMTDPANTDFQVIGVDPDDPHAATLHNDARTAYETVLAAMPSTTATDSAAIFDTAYRWTVGQPQDCNTDPFAGISGDPGVPRPTGTGTPVNVAVATWNTLYTNPVGNVVAGIKAIGATTDVIGLQELSSANKRRQVEAGINDSWAMYAGGDGNNTTPIVWRRDKFDVLAYGAVRASGLVRVEPGSSGTAVGPRWISWVQLRQKSTGGAFVFVNTHFIPTIDDGGRPDVTRPIRLKVYDQEVDALMALVDRLKTAAPVIGTMDANIDARKDAQHRDPRWPYVRMGKHGVYTNWRVLGPPTSGGTHDTRLIDWVWSTSATIIPTGQQIGNSYGSDHKALRVTLSNAAGSSRTTSIGTASASPAASAALPDRLTVPGAQPGTTMTLTGEQVPNAAIVIGEGKAHQVPMFGWVVALTAALQESGIRNLAHGDRDSQGMFQQRPSSGWGTGAQIRDPHLATRAFYGVADHTSNRGLTDIHGWQDMSVTAAAQAVQVSAFPEAYAKWEAAARAIVQQLAGVTDPATTSAGPACDTDTPAGAGVGSCPATGMAVENGLTPDALLVARCTKQQFPQISTMYGIGNRPANTDDDHQTGRAVDLMIPDYASPTGSSFGWQVASWIREHHRQLGVHYVIYAAKIWNVDRDAEGWRTYRSITGSNDPTSLHYDHVHVSVFGDAAVDPSGDTAGLPAGAWTMPLPKGSYRVGCGFGCYPGHTGQDFPVPAGTPLRSSDDGIVIRSEALRDAAGNYRSYGNLIVVAAAGSPGTTVWYAHLSRRDVTVGQRIRAGQIIGATGYTGHTIPHGPAGAHLHYEIRVDGSPTNPLPILRRHGVTP